MQSIQDTTRAIADRSLHYLEAGSQHGQPIILLHGGFADAWHNWQQVMQQLADHHHVIAPDLPGYGQSDPLSPTRLAALLDWLRDLMDALEIEQAVLVGHSFGGLIARLFAAAYPQHVPALVLINGGVIPHVTPFARSLAALPGLGTLTFRQISRGTTSPKRLGSAAHHLESLPADFLANARKNSSGLARLMQGLTRSEVPEARRPLIPVMLLWGENDLVAPLRAGEQIRDNIPGARLMIITECGHLPQVEVPDVISEQIRYFVQNFDRQSGLPASGPLSDDA